MRSVQISIKLTSGDKIAVMRKFAKHLSDSRIANFILESEVFEVTSGELIITQNIATIKVTTV